MKRLALLALAVLLPASAGAAPSAWVEFVPGGSAEVRAVVQENACPSIDFDGVASRMTVRAAADEHFHLVCSAPIPSKTRRATIDGVFLPVPPADPQRILVLGDTGCRIKGTYLQACNDPVAWPFAGLAKAAAAMKPDVILHLGDFLYRESPCPEGNQGCAGSPYGDNWDSWNADFFTPAAPLLAAAPLIIVRGNHEDCSRSGPGFLRLLGPLQFDPAQSCVDHLEPYAVELGGQTVAVMDDASAPDTSVDANLLPVYQRDFQALMALENVGPGQNIWLAAHRPIWAAISGPLGVPIGGNATLIEAAGELTAFRAISLMLSGHIHTFEAINYQAKVPPQIVAGHGGDNLDPTPANLHGAIFQGHSGVQVKDGLSVGGFGFLMMTRQQGSDGWSIQLYDSNGVPGRQCQFAAGRVFCLAAR